MDLPPILPDIEQQLKEYLICPERLPIHRYESNQEFWPCDTNISTIFNCEVSPVSTTLKVHRDHVTGKILGFREVPVQDAGSNPQNSFSLNRSAAPSADSVKGEPNNFPFWPGGFPNTKVELPQESQVDFTDLLTIPPGFTHGVQFEGDGRTVLRDGDVKSETQPNIIDDDTINILELIKDEHDLIGLWDEPQTTSLPKEVSVSTNLDIENDVLPAEHEIPVLNISEARPRQKEEFEWAIELDSQQKIADFSELVPDMAFEYPFELDTFQKQAVIKLEENRDVFVAAHTSAGKTVVAEYAIALSQKHQTRTIYTSPIKALSNQKYRDFKNTFNDVGLITGDFQINQSGTCLIMTTEILRSMLYCGSELIRDLEFVIFDEVHYINDRDRGHVWEEVIILLPPHVRIVLLSATVPNTMQFANWIGCTKERIVYVIKTLHRPVPLQHYLYTSDGKKGLLHLLISASGKFLREGLITAMDTFKTNAKNQNANPRSRTAGQEKTSWVAIVNHLKANELLPVVVFTFSRLKCDVNAQNLLSMDLTTAKEKSKTHSFYQRCVSLLKPPDRELPQVIMMRQLLEKGIGVHHSGILPILKEIVEILFQKGLIKILFATETFAMGVNMPARTVVFNDITKFDGLEHRMLNPAEYIQMAGRAGRRGLDKTGTVIIRLSMEKKENYTEAKLKNMMLGTPQKLESQFRLTYSMLLSLLRVESLNVEYMMERSFSEIDHVQSAGGIQDDIKKTEEEYTIECNEEISEHHQQLVEFYEAARNYIDDFNYIQPNLLAHPKVSKYLTPGRIVIVNYNHPQNKPAILLTIKKTYRVLVLEDQSEDADDLKIKLSQNNEVPKQENTDPTWNRILSFTEPLFVPTGIGGHRIIDINPTDVIEIVKHTIKVDENLVIKDWEQRQIPRFRDNPPGKTCQQAIQELLKVSLLENLELFDPIVDFHIDSIDLVENISLLSFKKGKMLALLGATRIANFKENFKTVYRRKHLQDKLEALRFKNSLKSLNLYPEYTKRIKLLNKMKYINEQNRVEMKGKVACQMGMNELLITELVFRNILTNLQPAQVAALLSALVLQFSTKDQELELPEPLRKGRDQIKEIYNEISHLENELHIETEDGGLNFNLAEVVYEWAQQKPFAEIMKFTEFQEGIVVRCIQQLNEILKDVRDAAMLIGDPVLQSKMEEASTAIKRDIVFTASLYTQKEVISF